MEEKDNQGGREEEPVLAGEENAAAVCGGFKIWAGPWVCEQKSWALLDVDGLNGPYYIGGGILPPVPQIIFDAY